MEGEGGATQETGEQNLPPETTEVNGDTIAPIIDRKEAVKLRDEGTEVMVNGDDDDNDSMNVSLDTQTQTREDEFPPDEYGAGPTTGDDQSKEGGLGPGKEGEMSQELQQKEEEEEGEENKGSGNNEVEGAVVDDEKEDSSEGYGSQDADKALENEGDGTEEPGKDDGQVESEKEPEVALSQDEGLASPEVEDSQLTSISNQESGLKPVVPRESEPAPEQEEQFDADGQRKSYVKSAVKMREKTGTRVNSHVVKQSRISFVEQEVLRHKQQEEEFRREREMRNQERMRQGKPPSPSSLSPPDSAGNSRLQSPTSPEPPTTTMTKPVKAPIKPTNSKAKAVYQELKYNPKTGGGNRSNAMVKQWESKFK